VRGTIRLTEIEIYGLEKKDEAASMASEQDIADEQMLDLIFAEEATAPISSDSTGPTTEDFPSAVGEAAVSSQAPIEAAIRGYASAYTNRDLSALMATISPSYLRDGENYDQLRQKMADVFRRYTQIDFSLERLHIQDQTGTATVDANYVAILTPAGRSPSTISGRLFFALTESEHGWQIVRIDTQGR
jgi:ketosteroid isomerase-like protein